MRQEIEAYLREHGARYTTDALRRQLIHAGYEDTEVEAALRDTESARAPQFAETRDMRRRFWLLAIGLNIIGIVAATIWAGLGPSATYAGLVPFVLGFFMLVGLGISGLIGRAVLRRGLAIALVIPAVFALLLTGVCMAMFGLPTGAI